MERIASSGLLQVDRHHLIGARSDFGNPNAAPRGLPKPFNSNPHRRSGKLHNPLRKGDFGQPAQPRSYGALAPNGRDFNLLASRESCSMEIIPPRGKYACVMDAPDR
jgi:hypothetical protein